MQSTTTTILFNQLHDSRPLHNSLELTLAKMQHPRTHNTALLFSASIESQWLDKLG